MTTILMDVKNLNQTPKIKLSCGLHSMDEKTLTKTPAKASAPAPSSQSADSQENNMGSLKTPTKGRGIPASEPWTPTSNLKILISAASPEIRNREKELRMDNVESAESLDSSQEAGTGDESDKLQISRKEKSLGLLCHKFLARYPDYPNLALNNDICLDDVAVELNVERRRIYDIMNVLESLHMVSRLAKNRYTWHGKANLPQTLATLRKVGEEHKYGEQMEQIKQRSYEREFDFDSDEKENEQVCKPGDGASEPGQKEMFFVELPGVEFRAASVNSRKDKSLRVMSQKFVMLFLVSTPRVVSLEVAAKILIGEDHVTDLDKSKFKTKIRRLYDIANVLSSLELIKKVHVTEDRGRKPAFKWTGPEDFTSIRETSSAISPAVAGTLESRASIENCAKNLFSSAAIKHSFTRHPSLIKLAKSIQEDRRKINSAPTSPAKVSPSSSSNAEFYPNKMAQLAAICKIQLDEQSKKNVTSQQDSTLANVFPTNEINCKTAETALTMEPNATSASQAHVPVQSAGTMPLVTSQYSHLIPVLIPQHQMGGTYALYIPPSVRPHPSSLAVRSMTFEDKAGGASGEVTKDSHSPGMSAEKHLGISQAQDSHLPIKSHSATPSALSPGLTLKRAAVDCVPENSPSKVLKKRNNSRVTSAQELGETLQAHPKVRRGPCSNRPSPRALHLDPEFVNTPESTAAEKLDQSVEKFLEKEESEVGLTPVRAIPVQEVLFPTGHLPAEALIPTGYLIPISQPSLINLNDSPDSSSENTSAAGSSHSVFHTPTAGSASTVAQEFTPRSYPLQLPASTVSISPFVSPVSGHRLHSPSPAILNFTLQNVGLIPSGSPRAVPAPTPPDQASPSPASLGFHQRGMVFVRPMSPVPLQSQAGQPLALLSLQQPLIATPKGTQPLHTSFFHTPVSTLSPGTAVFTPTGQKVSKAVYIPQRKLDITTEDN
ncbi:transcription factor E2F8 isoform X2 [Scleropages formosus]|uniref:transcription factor E2F8 isoform X2 n=1 Tax=Scleropages formosus TaxID=113540 RepID=UPI0010FA97DD|nr:transcription factor E2F8 isoform X2 [Scleropages formosus]